MSRMELSLTRGKDIPKRSPLRETLATNQIMGSPNNEFLSSPSPGRNSTEDNNNTTTDEDEEQVGLHHELFTYLINRSRTKKVLSFLLIAFFILLLVEYILFQNVHISSFTEDFLDWLSLYGDVAVTVYVIMMSILTLLFVPPSVFVFASGFIFRDIYGSTASGIGIAWVSSFIGAMIGGSLGFWRARYLSRDLVEILMKRYPILRAVDVAIVKNSLRVMMLMRLNPLIPFGVLNYVFGVTGVDLATFILAMPAVLPWYLFLVCLGAVSSSMYSEGIEDNLFGVILISTGVASGIIGMVITWRYAKKELQKDAEMDKWRMVDPKEMPEVGTRSRSPTPTAMMMAESQQPPNQSSGSLGDDSDEENLSNTYDESLCNNGNAGDDIQIANDDYNDNNIAHRNIDNTNSSGSGSNLGETVKKVTRKLKFSSKSSEEEVVTPAAIVCHPTHTNFIIEERDLGFTDYFRTQVLGEDQYDENVGSTIQQSYRKHLDWTEIILDDFS